MELALSLSISVVALIIAIPALFLSVYACFALKDMSRQMGFDAATRDIRPQDTIRNFGLSNPTGDEVPAIYDNLIEPDFTSPNSADEDDMVGI